MELRSIFTAINYSLGALLILLCLNSYFKNGKTSPLHIASAVILAGPVEDLLNNLVPAHQRWIVDQLTSIGFLLFLILAVVSMNREI